MIEMIKLYMRISKKLLVIQVMCACLLAVFAVQGVELLRQATEYPGQISIIDIVIYPLLGSEPPIISLDAFQPFKQVSIPILWLLFMLCPLTVVSLRPKLIHFPNIVLKSGRRRLIQADVITSFFVALHFWAIFVLFTLIASTVCSYTFDFQHTSFVLEDIAYGADATQVPHALHQFMLPVLVVICMQFAFILLELILSYIYGSLPAYIAVVLLIITSIFFGSSYLPAEYSMLERSVGMGIWQLVLLPCISVGALVICFIYRYVTITTKDILGG